MIAFSLVVFIFGTVGLYVSCFAMPGCAAAGGDMAGINTEIVADDMTAIRAMFAEEFTAFRLEVKNDIKAGRDVNEPVTGWILAAGIVGVLAMIPAAFLFYFIGCRFGWFRRVVDRIKGKPENETPFLGTGAQP